MNKAEEFIACLEVEIAKRDEELAACRVAVENCEVFRARVAELEEEYLELASLSSRVSVELPIAYAAPVSEAKAQGVVLPKSAIMVGRSELALVRNALALDCEQGRPVRGEMLAALDASIERFDRLNAAPVQQVGVPDGYVLVPQRIELTPADIASIMFHCGGDEEATEVDEMFVGGVLWVGGIKDDDDNIVHGLHIATADYPEEGGTTLVEFAAAPAAPGAKP